MTKPMNDMVEEEIIAYLIEKYKANEDATDTIFRARSDIEYLRTKKDGQTTRQYLYFLINHLEMWF